MGVLPCKHGEEPFQCSACADEINWCEKHNTHAHRGCYVCGLETHAEAAEHRALLAEERITALEKKLKDQIADGLSIYDRLWEKTERLRIATEALEHLANYENWKDITPAWARAVLADIAKKAEG